MRVSEWKDSDCGKSATQTEPTLMSHYGKENDIEFLKFTASTYILNVVPGKVCTMLIVYRLNAARRKTDNNYIMIGDGNRDYVKWKSVGFNGKHTKLMITDGKGTMMELDKFPKTSPLAKDVWHCLCVKWSADGDGSIWLNAKKIKSFISGYNTQSLILGGRFLDDDTGFHGDIALFQMYNNVMKDEELFMIQTKWCEFFKIPSDDGDFLYPQNAPQPFLSFADYCRWFPVSTILNFQLNEEDASFFITDTKKDTQLGKSGEIIKWFSRTKNPKSLDAKLPSKKFISIKKGFALAFDKTHYIGDRLGLMVFPGYGYLCITFCTTTIRKQVLVTGYLQDVEVFNEIVVSKSMVTLIGFDGDEKLKEVGVQHDCSKYTTLFIEWIRSEDSLNASGNIWIDNKKRDRFSFTVGYVESGTLDIGMREDNSFPFQGNICAFEMYHKEDDEMQSIPDAVRNLIITNQMSLTSKNYCK